MNCLRELVLLIETYKKQIEEAEKIAALNLAKFRKAQQGLEEAEDREKMAGTQLSMTRVGSVVSRICFSTITKFCTIIT